MRITADLLISALGARRDLAELYAPHLDAACARYEINTPLRLAHFLAQVGHESSALVHSREVWGPTAAQERYEGRIDLGNTQAGDGRRYMGRGLLQTTGRSNYRALRDRLRARGIDAPDFEAAPELLEKPDWASLSACDYWAMRGINRMADRDDHHAVTLAVNGGTNGIEDRRRRLERVKAVLAAVQQPAAEPGPATEPWQSSDPAKYSQEGGMPLPALAAPFLMGLANSLIGVFAPLAQEKITKEINRHTDKPQVGEQIATALIDGAKTLTGKPDPIAAVAAAREDQAIVAKLQADALADLDKLLPVLDKLNSLEGEAWRAEEESRRNADERAHLAETDQDPFLTRAIVWLLAGVLVGGSLLALALAALKVDVQTIVGALILLVGTVGGKFGTRYDHRYGSSRGSAAKDVITAELARRNRTPAP